jgi:hypothetical protein
MKQVYDSMQDIENIFESNLLLAPAYEFKKSFSNDQITTENQLISSKIIDGNANTINIIVDSNSNDRDKIDEATNASNGVIFSKVSRLNDDSNQIIELMDDYNIKHEERGIVMNRDIHTRDQGKRRSKKKKRNILRDPDDKRTVTKNNSNVYRNGLKRRNDVKKSLDSRINGQNILQVSKKISGFYYKDDGVQIVITSDSKNKINDKSAAVHSEVLKTKSNLFGSKEVISNKKAHQNDLYNNYDKTNKYSGLENKPLVRNKTTRPLKARKFKMNKTNRETDSVKDNNLEAERRDNSLITKNTALCRQKTFDTKSQHDKNMTKRNIAMLNNERAYQQQIYYDKVIFYF